MRFIEPLREATLLKRTDRYLAEIMFDDMQHGTIICPYYHDLLSCETLGSRIWCSKRYREGSILSYQWELVEVDGGQLVGINETNSKKVIEEAILSGEIVTLSGYQNISKDIEISTSKYNIDFLLTNESDQNCYVAIQHIFWGDEIMRGFYPQQSLELDLYILRELYLLCEQGARVVLLFAVQNNSVNILYPARHIAPEYLSLLERAMKKGLEVYAYKIAVGLEGLTLDEEIEFVSPVNSITES
jgi:sugar fermentation stimulation protein A